MDPHQIVQVASFAAVAVAVYALLALADSYSRRVRDRVNELEQASGLRKPHSMNSLVTTVSSSRMLESVRRFGRHQTEKRSQLRHRFAKAGIHNPSAISLYFAARFLLMVLFAAGTAAVGFAGYLQPGLAAASTCLMAAIGAIVPSAWLDRAIGRYRLQLNRSLPDFLDLMTVCLAGGLSFQETVRRVTDEMRLAHSTLAGELHTVQRDMELGSTIDQTLRRFAARTDYEAIRTLSTFIREAQRFGTNITEALRSHADMLRSQREQAAEERAQKASVKILLPTLLLIFPATFVVIVGPAIVQIQTAFSAK